MKYCYHTTKTKFLASILRNGLQPIYGNNSSLTVDSRVDKISYSLGMQGLVNTFNTFTRFYNYVLEGRVNEDNFRKTLSPQDYSKHQQSLEDIRNSGSFQDWLKDNIYLCFDGNYLSEKNEEKIGDSFTTQSIPANQLKVCVIKNNLDNTIYSYSIIDIYCILYAKNPELKRLPCTYRYEKNIEKFKSDQYSLEYIDLERFCEMFPELLNTANGHNVNTTGESKTLTLDQIGKGTTTEFSSNPEQASRAFKTLELGFRTPEDIKKGQNQGEK